MHVKSFMRQPAHLLIPRTPGTDMVCMAAIVCPVNSDSSSPRAAYSRGTLPIAHNYRSLAQALKCMNILQFCIKVILGSSISFVLLS